MLPAFVAALIGGFGSLTGALAGAALVGVAQGIVPAFAVSPGDREFAASSACRNSYSRCSPLGPCTSGAGSSRSEIPRAALAGDADATPVHTAFDPAVLPRRGGRKRVGRYVILALLIAWPYIGIPSFMRPLDTFSVLGDAILAAQYFVAASSIVMLTGWVGQISLSQAAFVGISAFGSALFDQAVRDRIPVQPASWCGDLRRRLCAARRGRPPCSRAVLGGGHADLRLDGRRIPVRRALVRGQGRQHVRRLRPSRRGRRLPVLRLHRAQNVLLRHVGGGLVRPVCPAQPAGQQNRPGVLRRARLRIRGSLRSASMSSATSSWRSPRRASWRASPGTSC